MSRVFYYFLFFFKVNYGVFVHNRVATLHETDHVWWSMLSLLGFLLGMP